MKMYLLSKASLIALISYTMLSPILSMAQDAHKVAIFVANRAGAELNDQAPVFEDLLIANVADKGFEVISREMILNAAGDLLQVSEPNELDRALSDQTSALRLSQNLGADYLLLATLMGMDKETRTVNAYGVNYENQLHTLRTSYRILDGNSGASITAGTSNPTRSIQQSQHATTSVPGLIRELLDKAGSDIAAQLGIKSTEGRIRTVDLAKEQVSFEVVVSLSDVMFPEVDIDDSGRPRVTANKGTVQALAVSVEMDGMMIGTTGTATTLTQFSVSPGLHRIRLSRDDLEPFERMVNISDGMQLNITMQLSEQGRQRWLENTRLLNELKADALLTDAQAEELRGMAQMLRQSGYKVDMKVDTQEGITIEKNQSMMRQD